MGAGEHGGDGAGGNCGGACVAAQVKSKSACVTFNRYGNGTDQISTVHTSEDAEPLQLDETRMSSR